MVLARLKWRTQVHLMATLDTRIRLNKKMDPRTKIVMMIRNRPYQMRKMKKLDYNACRERSKKR